MNRRMHRYIDLLNWGTHDDHCDNYRGGKQPLVEILDGGS